MLTNIKWYFIKISPLFFPTIIKIVKAKYIHIPNFWSCLKTVLKNVKASNGFLICVYKTYVREKTIIIL
ncbi:hypothetical protein ACO2J1_09680 [Leptospira interrogans]|uniref:Uncharacterized protein n=1 Tax=Leptospira interrogans serovar Pomona TaxID=44276 RepID=A0AA40WDR4_LEPIR|nr:MULTISPECIES: hypothetical protein [Leptospira]ASV05326.1 hypothetical protein B2G47_03695 [Leptospira interrogans serovar Canicola]ASV09515.1 hypothetical protein B2G50_14160 [Leptospira interrogans serovar Canicola]MBE8345239.1 hypothetical protein [Leptospira interrogans serovar Pomona]MBE8355143.1 hypothetical protein [Leptospira interrogans serovar Pomona]MBE8358902.1 hypothetical protein [Leptospira interrogans serovar Pomona]